MLRRILSNAFFLLCFSGAIAQHSGPRPVIFDTDMGPDYDDAGAITLLHAYADSGYIKILATVASTRYEGVAGVLNVFNTYFGRPDIPIGIPKTNGLLLRDWQHWTDSLLLHFPHRVRDNSEVPDAVQVYRKALAGQPDHSVTIITVGFFTNLANLLRSGPDRYAALSGAELVKRKVKQLVSMAGKFPTGKEFNVEKDAAASQYVFEHLVTPVIFSGFEIGQKIKVGLPLIHNGQILNSPVKEVFRIAIPMAREDSAGRMSWDETAVLVAVKGYAPFYTLQHGRIAVASDGSNSWRNDGRREGYLVEQLDPLLVQALINHLIQHQPVKQAGAVTRRQHLH